MCRLTLSEGIFVKSHIIPRALTKPELNGHRLIQIESKKKRVIRHDSWYDSALVSEEGENILRDLDDFGVSELRRLGILWSAKYPIGKLQLPFGQKTDHEPGRLQLETVNETNLRRFFTSIIWRSAASDLADMADVKLPKSDLEKLRLEVVGLVDVDPFFYPIYLNFYCTTGPRHNLSPFVRFTNAPAPFNCYIRLEMDGIVALTFPNASRSDIPLADRFGVVGFSRRLIVNSMPFEDSFGQRNLHAAIRDQREQNW